MNKLIKSWLDYREYLYYYKIILVVLLGTIIERKIDYDILGYLIRSIIEFIGIKYWVFKNDWNNKKGLKKMKAVLNFLKTGGIDRRTLMGNILYILYEFLTTSLLAYPFYRYIIFTPNK